MTAENGYSQRIIRNTVFNIAGRAWGLLVVLFLTPYVISCLGIERFGVWVLLEALISQFGLVDLGFNFSFIKYIAEYDAQKDHDKINQVINTGFICYLLVALIVILGGFLLIEYFIKLLNIPAPLHAETRFAFSIGIVIFAISQIFNPLNALQLGLQRYDIANKIVLALSVPQIAGTIFFLSRGYGITGLVINTAIIRILMVMVNLFFAFRLFPDLRLNLFSFAPGMFKRIFTIGYKIQITTVADWIQGQMNKFFLAYFLAIDAVSYFTAPNNLASRVREIPVWLTSALLPAASVLETQTRKESISRLYYYAMKYTVLVLMPLTAAIVLFAYPFIKLWLGEGFVRSSLTLQFLAIGCFFNALTAPAFFILNGLGKPKYAMNSAVIAVIINLTVSIGLVHKIGYMGIVTGVVCSYSVSAVYFIIMANRIIGVSWTELIKKIMFKPFLVCAAVFWAAGSLVRRMELFTWWSLFSAGLLFLVCTGLLIFFSGYFDAQDKAVVGTIVSHLRFLRPRERKL